MRRKETPITSKILHDGLDANAKGSPAAKDSAKNVSRRLSTGKKKENLHHIEIVREDQDDSAKEIAPGRLPTAKRKRQ